MRFARSAPLASQSFVALAFGERVDTPLCGGRGFTPLRMTRMGRNRGLRVVEGADPYGFVRNMEFVREGVEIMETAPPPTYVGPPPLTRGGQVCAKFQTNAPHPFMCHPERGKRAESKDLDRGKKPRARCEHAKLFRTKMLLRVH